MRRLPRCPDDSSRRLKLASSPEAWRGTRLTDRRAVVSLTPIGADEVAVVHDNHAIAFTSNGVAAPLIEHAIRALTASRDGRVLASTGDGDAVTIWRDRRPVGPPLDIGPVVELALAPSGDRLAALIEDGRSRRIALVDCERAERMLDLALGNVRVDGIAFAAAGHALVVLVDARPVRIALPADRRPLGELVRDLGESR